MTKSASISKIDLLTSILLEIQDRRGARKPDKNKQKQWGSILAGRAGASGRKSWDRGTTDRWCICSEITRQSVSDFRPFITFFIVKGLLDINRRTRRSSIRKRPSLGHLEVHVLTMQQLERMRTRRSLGHLETRANFSLGHLETRRTRPSLGHVQIVTKIQAR